MNSPECKFRNEKIAKFLTVFFKYNSDLNNQEDTISSFIIDIVFFNNTLTVKQMLDPNIKQPNNINIKHLIREFATIYGRKEISELVKEYDNGR